MKSFISLAVLVLTAFVASASFAAEKAVRPNETPAFIEAFTGHLQKGTLLDYRTPGEFIAKGWGLLYQQGVAARFQGAIVDDLQLVIALRGNAPRKGEPLSLMFRLFNNSEKDATVSDGGICGTTHAATFMVLDSSGQLVTGYGHGKVGGPHCFCNQNKVTMPPHSARWLDTRTDSDAVVAWRPDKAGRYVIIGVYSLFKGKTEQRVLSKPLLLDVK